MPIALWKLIVDDVERSLRGRFAYSYNGREMQTKIEHVLVLREGEVAYAALSKQPAGRAQLKQLTASDKRVW